LLLHLLIIVDILSIAISVKKKCGIIPLVHQTERKKNYRK